MSIKKEMEKLIQATPKKGVYGIIIRNRGPTISRKYLVGVVVKNDLGLNLLSLSK